MSFLKKLIPNENFKEVVSGSFASLVTKATGILLNYLLIFLISTKIGVDYVGFYNILLVFLFLITILSSLGLNYAVIPLLHKYVTNKKELYTKSLTIILGLLLVISLLFYTLSSKISNYLFSEYNNTVYGIILVIIVYVFMLFNIEFIRASKNIKVSESLRNISFPLLTLLGIFSLDTYFEDQFYVIVVSIFLAAFLTLIPSLFYVSKIIKKTTKNPKKVTYKKLLKKASPLMIMGLSSFSLSEASLFILKYFFDIREVGNFTIIYKISIIACLVFTISSAIVGPKIAELFFNKNTKELNKIVKSSFKMIFTLSLPFFFLVLIFPSFFLGIFKLTSKFSTALIIMLIGQFLYGITAIFGLLLMVTDKQKEYRNIYIFSAFVNLILGFILIPKFEVIGAAITVAISYILLNLLCVIYVYKNKLFFN